MDLATQQSNYYWFPAQTVAIYPHSSPSHRGKTNRGITGMCTHDGRLYAARWSDILVLQPEGAFPPEKLEIVDILTHPMFNDLHDLRVENGSLLATSSGTETILQLDFQGNEQRRWSIFDAKQDVQGAKRIDPTLPYNRFSSTKPHPYHVNMAVFHQGCLFVTVCNTGEILSIDPAGDCNSFLTGLDMPHDGEFLNQGQNFVVTNSQSLELVYYDVTGGLPQEKARIEFPENPSGQGWLRGIFQVDPVTLLVGMSVWKKSQRHDLSRIYRVDLDAQNITDCWKVPGIYDAPDATWRGTLGRLAAKITRPLRKPYYGNPNIYKILAWPE